MVEYSHCPKCGKKVSEKEDFCPSCGHRIKSRLWLYFLIIIGVILFLIIWSMITYFRFSKF